MADLRHYKNFRVNTVSSCVFTTYLRNAYSNLNYLVYEFENFRWLHNRHKRLAPSKIMNGGQYASCAHGSMTATVQFLESHFYRLQK